ncbi:hypothetical protein [Nocardia sp. NRRL S-836]|uniref:hypothetical protein n=1 Tax=Nocardia sp. NRRL S-836 TaxID=1519492 RepID=UPI0006AF02CA|nr:hypothetical protein [Nocardia sp. NRRL S-836]KOV81509.1 hypothetical protein ADL03_29375 [Nocardia sp. NRRL S-836]
MTDRRIAAGVVLLGGVLTAVSCSLDMYVTRYSGTSPGLSVFFSLWGVTSDAPGYPATRTTMSAALPVLLAAGVMVLAAVCALAGEKIARTARIVTVVGAGALFGVVLAFVVEVRYWDAVLAKVEHDPQSSYEQTSLPGLYLLAAGALVGLAGAVLAHRSRPPDVGPAAGRTGNAEPAGNADDATPPFGIPVGEQEAR